MANKITLDVNEMSEKNGFGRWFRGIIESTGLKQKAIAEEAGINPVSLSRILSGDGVAIHTAVSLARAVNNLTGRAVAKEAVAISFASGLANFPDDTDTDPHGLYSGMEKLSPERQQLAKRQIKAILDALAEEEHDTDYIDDDA